MIEIPPVVREKALAVGARAWVDELPQLIRAIEADWGITVGRVYPDSTEALLAEAICQDGAAAVLKLIVPRDADAAAHEATVLRLAAGEGCPRLLRADVGRGALLLERLGRSLYELQLPIRRRHEILLSAAARIWRPAPDAGLPTGAAKARWLAELIARMWEELDRPCSERAVDYALACAERREGAHRDETAALTATCTSGTRSRRALRSSSSTRTAYSPNASTTSGSSCARIRSTVSFTNAPAGSRSGRASTRREWGVVERVSTGLLGTRVVLQPIARQMLAAADRVAG